ALVPLVDHHLGANTRRALEAPAVASGLVLLLAGANVAVLLLVQAMARRGELAVRRALGASAVRAVLEPLAESGLLACAGGLGGLVLAAWALRALRLFGPSEVPGLRNVVLDAPVLGALTAGTLLAALLLGTAPAWLALRMDLTPAVRTTGGA